MRRHPALQDLSRDHHDLLLWARRLEGKDPRVTWEGARLRWAEVERGWRQHLAEEDVLLAHAPAEAQARIVAARRVLEAAFRSPDGALLREHVAALENDAFEAIQAAWGKDGAAAAAADLAAARAARTPEACLL